MVAGDITGSGPSQTGSRPAYTATGSWIPNIESRDVMCSSLRVKLGFDPKSPGDMSAEELKVKMETSILENRLKRSELTNGIHLEFVELVASKLLTIKQSAYLHVVWVMGR